MRMNRLYILLIIVSTVFTQARRDVIALADLESSGLSNFEARQIYDRLETELVNLGTYDVTSRQEVDKILKEQKFQQLSGCTDQQCAAKLGKMLNADLMLLSTILYDHAAAKISATFKLVDVETARITTAVSRDSRSISKLNENIDDMLADLYRKSTRGGVLPVQMIAADETLFEIVFNLNVDGVDCSYNQFAPITSAGKTSIFKLARGEYTFYFQKNQYKPYTKVINVDSDQSFKIVLEEDKSQIVKYKPPGIISIETDPQGCEIIINGQKIGSSPYSGLLTSGEHQLELRKELYYTAVLSFSLEAGETKNIKQSLDPKFGHLNITSIPSGARITIDGKTFGVTPLSSIKLLSGRHELKAEKELYHPHSATYDVQDAEEKKVELVLSPAYGKLHITSSPEVGAVVYVDGQKRGTTPFLFDPCPSGQYLIEVKKQYYNTVTEQVTVADNAEVRRTIILAPNVGTLIVSAPSSRIFINGENVGRNSYEAKLPPGKYVVKAERSKHYPETKDVIITVGKTEEIQLTPSPIQGSISIFVNPIEAKKAEILINGESKGQAPNVFTIPIGDYSVEVQVKGFLNKKKDVTVKENENTTVNLTLLSYAGSIQQEVDRWKLITKLSGGATITFAILAGVCEYVSSQSYDNYIGATSTSKALDFKSKTKIYDALKLGGSVVAIASAGGALYSYVNSKLSASKLKKKKRTTTTLDLTNKPQKATMEKQKESSFISKLFKGGKYVVSTGTTYIWDYPDIANSNLIKKLAAGEKLPFNGLENDWVTVKLGNKSGYIWSKSDQFYVTDDQDEPVDGQRVKITVVSDNIRSGPSTSYQIIKKCRENETYPILDIEKGWYKIRVDKSTIGYTHKTNGKIIFRKGLYE
ncbi:MAG: PEGA domain-containing protein [Candidatus Marinimicrobia bacterium]|nr:PEGA domain-containing protein [Candidatus Neomarinimicrobiota bacterium]